MKKDISYIPGRGSEWREDPKHAMGIISNRSKEQAKATGSPCSNEVGKSIPKVLDALESKEARQYRSDTGRVLYICSGRFDLQYAAELLGEQTSTPLRLGEAWAERCARYLTGCPHLCLVFRRESEAAGSWILVDSSWADEADRYSTHSAVT